MRPSRDMSSVTFLGAGAFTMQCCQLLLTLTCPRYSTLGSLKEHLFYFNLMPASSWKMLKDLLQVKQNLVLFSCAACM